MVLAVSDLDYDGANGLGVPSCSKGVACSEFQGLRSEQQVGRVGFGCLGLNVGKFSRLFMVLCGLRWRCTI